MILISPEFVAVIAGLNVTYWWPSFMEKVGLLFLEKDLIQYCAIGLPLAGFYFAYKTVVYLLHPPNAEGKGFYEWSSYPLLRYHGYFTVSLCLLGLATSILLLLFRDVLTAQSLGSIYGTVTCTWFVSIITLGMARLKVGAILGGEK